MICAHILMIFEVNIFNIFYSFNPNHAYWNQRRLFSGNMLGMFKIVFTIWSLAGKQPQSSGKILTSYVINSRSQRLNGSYLGALLFFKFRITFLLITVL